MNKIVVVCDKRNNYLQSQLLDQINMQSDKQQIRHCLQLSRRMPASQLQNNLSGLLRLVDQDSADILRQKVCIPHKIKKDSGGNLFIATQFNRDGDSHRSPFTSQYVPSFKDGFQPSQTCRQLQQKANLLFNQYVMLYYDKAVGSFFVTDQDYGFDCAFFVHKDIQQQDNLKSGTWDSFNIFSVKLDVQSMKVTYKLKTTVLCQLQIQNQMLGTLKLSGFLQKGDEKVQSFGKKDKQQSIDDLHLQVIGTMVEENESKLRKQMESVEAQKTRQILCSLRSLQPIADEEHKKSLAKDLKKKIKLPSME